MITVGITCYNEGDWLLECWESVLAQTDGRWQAVLVMDGTTHQRTREIFEQLQHPKLRKYALPRNVGHGATRNKAFELTETPYHFYLDGDDQLLPDSVACVLEVFERQPQAGIVYGDYELFGSGGGLAPYPREVRPDMFVEGQCVPGGSAYRMSVWKQLGGFAPELSAGNSDYDFMLGVAEAGIPVVHCGRVIYRYRQRTRLVAAYGRRYHETHEIMVRRHPDFFRDPKRRNRFLALGYRWAARANYVAGDRKRAAELARVAFRKGLWHDPEVLYMAGGTCLPTWGYGGLVKVRNLARRAAGLLLKPWRSGG